MQQDPSECEYHPTNAYGAITADSATHNHSLSRNVNMDVYTQHRALIFNIRATLPGTAAACQRYPTVFKRACCCFHKPCSSPRLTRTAARCCSKANLICARLSDSKHISVGTPQKTQSAVNSVPGHKERETSHTSC
jgi:hypothetical protein